MNNFLSQQKKYCLQCKLAEKSANFRSTYFYLPIIFIFCCSCTIKKRVYLPGYHLEWAVKRKTTPTPKQYEGYSVNAYNSLSTKPVQEMCINISESNTVVCKEGTIIEFPSNAFTYKNGRTPKCSIACVSIWEFYSLADIIKAGLTTTSAGNILSSEGMIYIEVGCHGEKLKLKPDKKLSIKMPTKDPKKEMKAFSGNIRNGIIDWSKQGNISISENNDLLPSLELENDSLPSLEPEPNGGNRILDGVYSKEDAYFNNYLISLNKMGWINCDRFYEIEKQTNLIVKLDSAKQTFVAIIFKKMKSVLPGYCFANNTVDFERIPFGETVSVLAYRINYKEKTVMVAMRDVVLGEIKQVDLDLEKMDLDNFKSLLASYE